MSAGQTVYDDCDSFALALNDSAWPLAALNCSNHF
jgi:hypothetical protein